MNIYLFRQQPTDNRTNCVVINLLQRRVPIKTERVFCLWTAIQPKNLIIFKTAESKLLF